MGGWWEDAVFLTRVNFFLQWIHLKFSTWISFQLTESEMKCIMTVQEGVHPTWIDENQVIDAGKYNGAKSIAISMLREEIWVHNGRCSVQITPWPRPMFHFCVGRNMKAIMKSLTNELLNTQVYYIYILGSPRMISLWEHLTLCIHSWEVCQDGE